MVNKNQKSIFKIALIPAAVALFAGCADRSTVSESTSNGVAYDGYLVGATVCADLNRNKVCDAGEPSTTTGAGGKFTLNLTGAATTAPLVLQANDKTVDAGDDPTAITGDAVDTDLVYSAPAGSKAVSALSTLIQNLAEQEQANGANATTALAAAVAKLKTQLGITGNSVDLLNDDIVAKKSASGASNEDKILAARLHLVNQAVTAKIKTVAATAKSSFGSESNSTILNATLSTVVNAVQAIFNEVVTLTGDSSATLAAVQAANAKNVVSNTVAKVTVQVTSAIITAQKAIDTAVNSGSTAGTTIPPVNVGTGGTGATGGSQQ
ncbi:MAG: hypothetical protein H7A00_17380 [Hahellaceae bacterium]|nr:hypothetical protein [Hahellaceae bacterium]